MTTNPTSPDPVDPFQASPSQLVRTALLEAPAGQGSVRLTAILPGDSSDAIDQTLTWTLKPGTHVLGRGDNNEIRIAHTSLSRVHVRIHIDERITLCDLGSTNGTSVRGARLVPNQDVEIEVGESFEVGNILCVVQRVYTEERAPIARKLGLRSHDYFEERVDEECAVGLQRGGHIYLARVSPHDPLTEQALTILRGLLPSSHVLGEYGPNEMEILIARSDEPSATRMSERLLEAFRQVGFRAVRIGIAAYPIDGRDASQLLAVANDRLRNAHASGSPTSPAFQEIIGTMARLDELVARVARSDIRVILKGETGVGKEVMARRIHEKSARAGKPFVGLNCAALTETLLESELFGHEKGAFSGAVAAKPGLLETAEGGTVFLDEIAEMSLTIQAKLLRVLEERKVMRVGGLQPRPISVRFLSASHRDLEQAVAEGKFRQDLFFRLNGISLEIPPLRDRKGEIRGLADAFLRETCVRMERPEARISDEALALLFAYDWPGNIRELRNMMERAVVLCDEDVIGPEHLPVERLRRRPLLEVSPLVETSLPVVEAGDARGAVVGRGVVALSRGVDEPTSSLNLRDEVAAAEKRRIEEALRECEGNQTKAAERLGISRRTLVSKLDEYALPRPRKNRP